MRSNRRLFALCVSLAAATGLSLARVTPVHAQARPMIEHIEPTSGPPGTRVQIVGRGFRASARVLFNEHEVPLIQRLPERLTLAVPEGAQSGRFVVAHGSDEVESEVFRVTAPEPPPTITSIEPTSAGPGSEVVVHGTNFGARTTDNEVRIGALPMVVRSGDPTALHVIVPDGATTGPLTVRTSGGEVQSPSLNVSARVIVRDFTPTATAPGSFVVLHGSGFGDTPQANHVTLGGRAVRVTRATASEIEIQVPRDAQGGGSIVVEVPGAGRFETGAALRVAPAALITAIDPPQAPIGARVTLRGQRFGADMNAVRVTLGETIALVVSVAPTELVVEVPHGASSGRWNVTVGGIGPVQSPDFVVPEAVTVASFAPRAGDAGDHVTLTGTGFSPTLEQNTVHLGTAVARVISANGHELVVEVPAARSGQWTVAVAGNGEAHAREAFMVTLRPHIASLEPAQGVVGDRVTLHGENFPGDRALVQVRLQDVECNVESTARDAIVVTVPRGLQPGPATFSVVARLQGTGHAATPFRVLVPTRLASLNPAGAPVGAHVVIRGEGFEVDPHALHVHLGTLVIHPVGATTTAIEFVVPRNAASGAVTVEADGRQTATAPFVVTVPPVIQSFAPARGAPGSNVTLRVRNLGTAPTVTLGATPCTLVSATPTSVVVQVPPTGATGRFSVHVEGQGDATTPRDFVVVGGAASANPASPAAH